MIILVIIICAIFFFIMSSMFASEKRKKLKDAYDKALRERNKKAALDAGRAYYLSIRKGTSLTIYDEQAIANDLNAME